VAAVDVPGINGVSGRRAEAPAGISLLEAGLVSASVFSILEMLRRRQSQRRPFGRRIRLPSGPDVQTELALRGGRRPEVADRIQRAVHSLYATTTASGEPLPAILGAVADGDAVEMLLATPTLPPSPWESAAGGFAWRVRDENLREAVPPFSEPLPALAPLGKAVGTGADVIVNLEAAGVIGVTGDPQRASGIIRAIAASLSGLPWAEAISLVLAGFGDELHAAPQARVIPAVGAVLAELRSTVAVMDEMLTRHGCATIWDARIQGLAGDGWPPTVVLCAEPPPDADLAELVSLAALRRGVVAVVPAAIGREQGWTLNADLVPMTVGPLRVAVEPTTLRGTELAAVGRVLDAAEDEAGATLDEPPYDRIELRSDWPEPPEGAASVSGHKVRQPAVLIRVLGSVELDGATNFSRAKSRELAVYLAMHPNGVGESELDEALWPSELGRVVPPSTRDSTVSVARTALGGPARLLPAQGQGREKRYQLAAEVGSDFDLFCRLHRHGRAVMSIDSLRAALGLVRGRPFEGVLSGRNYTWVHTEGHARHIEAEVGDAADMAATLLLEAGQPLEARWAARQGLAADPLCERLWIRLMQAADDLGESQEIERLMDELDIAFELGGDFSGLHPNTLAAYDRYRRGIRPRRS